MWNQATNLPEMREQQQYSTNSIKDNSAVVLSQSTKSKKKFRLFSKSSKNRDTSSTKASSNSSGPCYCEECVREATAEQQSSNNYYLPSNIQPSECYYPSLRASDQTAAYNHTRALLSSSQPAMYYENSHNHQSQYAPDNRSIDYIYPPPQQFPCECVNCRKSGANLTTELLPLDTQIPLQMMSADSALLCNIL